MMIFSLSVYHRYIFNTVYYCCCQCELWSLIIHLWAFSHFRALFIVPSNHTSVCHRQIVFRFNWLVLWDVLEVITVTCCTYSAWSLQVAELTRHVTPPHNPIDEFAPYVLMKTLWVKTRWSVYDSIKDFFLNNPHTKPCGNSGGQYSSIYILHVSHSQLVLGPSAASSYRNYLLTHFSSYVAFVDFWMCLV